MLPPPAPVIVQPRRSHLVAKPPVTIDYASELVALKAELFLLTVRVQQLEARPLPPLSSPSIWERIVAWWARLSTRWRS